MTNGAKDAGTKKWRRRWWKSGGVARARIRVRKDRLFVVAVVFNVVVVVIVGNLHAITEDANRKLRRIWVVFAHPRNHTHSVIEHT